MASDLGGLEPTAQANRLLLERAVDASDGHGEVLRLERRHHLCDGDARGLERARVHVHRDLAVEPTDYRHLGDAVDSAQLFGDSGIREDRELTRRERG